MTAIAYCSFLLALAAEPVRPADVMLWDSPASAAVGPVDRPIFVRQTVDPKSKQERFVLWQGGAEAKPIEAEPLDARRPILSPDGRTMVFASTRRHPDGYRQLRPVPVASEPAADLWVKVEGRPAVPLAGPDRPYGRIFHDNFYSGWAFAPDGRSMVFVAEGAALKVTTPAGVHVIAEDQGEGYTGYHPAQLWLATFGDAPGQATRIEPLTQDQFWYGQPQWLPDGKTIVVHANQTTDREAVRYSVNKNYDLYAIDVATRQQTRLTSGPGPEVYPRVSPDGRQIACFSSPRQGSHNDVANFVIITLHDGGPRTRVLFDHHTPTPEAPPHPPTHITSVDGAWGWDGNEHLTYNAPRGVRTELVRVAVADARGQHVEPTKNTLPQANPWLKDRALGEQRVFTWENEGRKLEGVLTLPPTGKAPFPLLLYPHGGPHSHSRLGFDLTIQVYAGAGYAVFQPNYRGSSGYGQAFLEADRGDLGFGDMRDMLTGVDALIREGIVDRDRQYLSGTSYGGYSTCWLVGQTRQFRAAVAVNAVTDLTMMWSLSDIPSWTTWEFGGVPSQIPATMRRHSPITYAGAVTTPTLILHSRDDRRCPLPMGVAYHRALHAAGVTTGLVIYDDEGHGIRQPAHRQDVLQRTLDWLAQPKKK